MRAVVVAHGDVDPADRAHAADADLIVAADGGSAHLARWGITPHIVIGDLDSLEEPAPGSRVERYPTEKDKTDTQLAVERAIAAGADDVIVLGALGGTRTDHALANTLLPAFERGRSRVRIVRGALSIRVVRGGERVALDGAPGDLVTLLAIGGDAGGVVTEGLRYPLHSETLHLGSSRGVSNEISGAGATVAVGTGALLVLEDRASALRSDPEAES